MAYLPTTFVDRSVEFPGRRMSVAVSGMANTFDISRPDGIEGTVFAEGTKPDAANLNSEFGKIKTETDAINTSLTNVNASGVTLFNGSVVANTTYTLSESIHNYHEIYVEANSSGSSKSSRKIPTDQLLLYTGANEEQALTFFNNTFIRFKFASATSVRINDITGFNALKIVGYNKK